MQQFARPHNEESAGGGKKGERELGGDTAKGQRLK